MSNDKEDPRSKLELVSQRPGQLIKEIQLLIIAIRSQSDLDQKQILQEQLGVKLNNFPGSFKGDYLHSWLFEDKLPNNFSSDTKNAWKSLQINHPQVIKNLSYRFWTLHASGPLSERYEWDDLQLDLANCFIRLLSLGADASELEQTYIYLSDELIMDDDKDPLIFLA